MDTKEEEVNATNIIMTVIECEFNKYKLLFLLLFT